MTNLIVAIRDALLKAGISPRKALSQNFLINSDILNKQIEFANLSSEDTVLEIGGGTGELTQRIAPKVKKLYCIEYDRELAQLLRTKFSAIENIEIIEGDVLKIDLPIVDKIIANLPYHISSPITFKLLDEGFDLAILMYQYEFARRMIAKPSTEDYSRLSANLQYQAEVEILMKVSKKNFYPPPKIDSAIVKISPKKTPLPVDINSFRVVSRLLFNTKNRLVATVFYDFLKRKIKKENRIAIRKQLNDKITLADTRIRDLTIRDLVQITEQFIDILTRNNLLQHLPEK